MEAENREWHTVQNERISRIASEMAKLFIPGHNVSQTPEYESWRQKYLWEQHIKAEHDKFEPPEYSDHLFG